MADEIREDFLESLQDLTVNSRPVIKTLTEIAQGFSSDAQAVVDAIDVHIRQSVPPLKLPAMYLLDSIVKNVGDPYKALFATRICSLFSTSFVAVSEPVKLKLEELYRTWLRPPIFPAPVLSEMGEFLAATHSAQFLPLTSQVSAPLGSKASPSPLSSAPARKLNQSSLLVEINVLVRAIQGGPTDNITEKHLALLARLQAKVQGPVDPRTFPEFQLELEGIRADYARYIARPRRERPSRKGDRGADRPDKGGERSDRGGERGTRGSDRSRRDRTREKHVNEDSWTGTNNVPLGSRKRPEEHSENSSAPLRADGSERTLERALHGLAVDLDAAAATPASISLIEDSLYGALSLQCPTCARRFSDTPEGRQSRLAEMDWHFRVARDLREGRSRHRLWFLSSAQWATSQDLPLSIDDDLAVEKSSGDGIPGSVDLDAARRQYVLVPSDSMALCPVCQEKHKSTWSEDEEDWVWLNCVHVDGLYFHATCFSDPVNKSMVEAIILDHNKKDL